jgi:cyclin-dependent kinase regulatory subunit CKS1
MGADGRYSDDNYEYRFGLCGCGGLMGRHVMLPKDALKVIPKDYFDTETGTLRILHEEEWRSLGITQVPPLSQHSTTLRKR